MDLSDFVQPLVLEKSEEFNLRQAKARFERVCGLLGVQAFWLAVFEYLEKHAEAVSGVRFVIKGEWRQSVVDMMVPVMVAGASNPKAQKAEKAFAGAMSKARGKIRNCDRHQMSMLADSLPANLTATLAGREDILAKALGADLYGLRRARMESQELDAAISDNFAAALSGKPRGPRL